MAKNCENCNHAFKYDSDRLCMECCRLSNWVPKVMSPVIIGITGPAGSGKDTVAQYFVKHFGYTRYALADPIKETVNALYGWNNRHAFGDLKEVVDPRWGVSPRYVYQRFGTEVMRELGGSDFWIKVCEMRTRLFRKIVVPDIRFNNEAEWVRKHGVLLHVVASGRGIKPVCNHTSENGVTFNTCRDIVIDNDGTLEDLQVTLDYKTENLPEEYK